MVLVTPVETIVCLSKTYFQSPKLKFYGTDVTVPGLASKRAANIFGISGRRSSILFDRALRMRIRNRSPLTISDCATNASTVRKAS